MKTLPTGLLLALALLPSASAFALAPVTTITVALTSPSAVVAATPAPAAPPETAVVERRLRALFLESFGPRLAGMKTFPPTALTVRGSAPSAEIRATGGVGFIFLDPPATAETPPPAVQFALQGPDRIQLVPSAPLPLTPGNFAILPFNFSLSGALLRSTTAQPVCRALAGGEVIYVFCVPPGVPATYTFSQRELQSESPITGGTVTQHDDDTTVTIAQPGFDADFFVTGGNGRRIRVVTLDRATAATLTKLPAVAGDHLVLAPDALVEPAPGGFTLRPHSGRPLAWAILPDDQPPDSDYVRGETHSGFQAYTLDPAANPTAARRVQLGYSATETELRRRFETVATVGGDPIALGELLWQFTALRSDIFDYFREKHAVDPGDGFWRGTFGGENPATKLKTAALAAAIHRKIVQQLCREAGLADDITYATFLERLAGENLRRYHSILDGGEPVFGPIYLQEENQSQQTRNDDLTHLREKRGTSTGQLTPGKPDSVDHEIAERTARLPVVINDDLYDHLEEIIPERFGS